MNTGMSAMTALWIALIIACIGSYALKLAGLSLPGTVLEHPVVQRVAHLLPVAMLSALVAVGLFDHDGAWGLDWQVGAGFAVAIILLILKRGFLVVFFGAVAATALLRLIF